MANGNRFSSGFDPLGALSTVLQLRGFQEQQRRQQINDRMREQNFAMQQLGFVTNLGDAGIDLQKEAPTLAQRFPLELREIGSLRAKLAKEQKAQLKEQQNLAQTRGEGIPGQIATTLAAGAPEGQQALQALQTQFQGPERSALLNEIGTKIPLARFALQRDSLIENAQKTSELAKQTFADEKSLRDEHTKASKAFVTQRQAFGRVLASADSPTAAGDLALIFNFMKILDPGSVVRESEFANAAATGSFGARVQAAVQRILTGKRLTAQQRADFLQRGRRLFRQARSEQTVIDRQFRALARKNGLDPQNVVFDLSAGLDPGKIPEAPPDAPEGTVFWRTSKGESFEGNFVEEGTPLFLDPAGEIWVP